MNTKRILIIDDDYPLTQAIKLNLEDTGDFEVCVENRSVKALQTARAFRPDLVLLDYIMPGLDGGDVSALFHKDPFLQNVPIIMLTALISNTETGDAGNVHSNAHVLMAKPVKFDKLIQTIELSLNAAAA